MTAGYSVAGGAECSAAGCAESFVIQDADCSVAGGNEYPSPLHVLPHSCKWGNAAPMSISL